MALVFLRCMQHLNQYRVAHLIGDLGWVDMYLSVPANCLPVQPHLPDFPQSRQKGAGSERLKIQGNSNIVRNLMGYPAINMSWEGLVCLMKT